MLNNESYYDSIQIGGTHYKDCAIEPWNYIFSNKLGYFEGNAIKYITRWKIKGGIADLEKAVHYLNKLIELESALDNEMRQDVRRSIDEIAAKENGP